MKTVIVYGPQGCGKSQHADLLLAMFGCSLLVDGWDGESSLQDGSLALTNVEPPYAVQADRVLSFSELEI